MEIIPAPIELDEVRRSSMLVDIRRRLSASADGDPSWPIEVKVGSPSRTLACEAAERHASMLVMGIGRHSPLDRLFGTETTLATLRESAVPVLAVGVSFSGAPSRIVVAMDFSVPSLQAAHLATKLVAPHGHITLVHVRPKFEQPTADWQAWDADYGRTLPRLFEQVLHELDAPSTVAVDTTTLRGDPAQAVHAYAQQEHADLIAMGTQRRGLIERLVVGSVATRVLRATRQTVLAVPGAAESMSASATKAVSDGKVA
jgi:nucleotide-binding universal stress UspA family protein